MATIRLNAAAKELLLSLIPSTAQAPVFVNAQSEPAQALSKHDLAVFNATMTDGAGKVAAILTDAGKAKAGSYSTKSDSETKRVPIAEPGSIVVEDNVPMPEFKRGGTGARSIYPFETMTVGQSFFIPATETRPEPFKAVQSSITSHNAKLRKAAEAAKATNPSAPAPAVFKAAEDKRGDVNGVRVWRTE